MALKDWRKIRDFKRVTTWKRIGQPRILEVYLRDEGFYTTSLIDDNTSRVLLKKGFKTKSQAMRYARSYMRRH